ncbi:MAG: NAD(P)-dependent oxidoreductase [Mycobacterium sp.]|nr:NAD(P)-dependent oxidoreductase [Mycobacterium sp.]
MSADTRKPVLVVGLGRFGGAVARRLASMGTEVLGVDREPRSGAGTMPSI